MTENHDEHHAEMMRGVLALLNKLPPRPQITFRGYVDRTVDRMRVVGSPALTSTSHSLEIATNNLARPEVAIVVGTNGRDLTPILAAAPGFNNQEVTYLPNSYFLQHVAHEYNGVTIQVYEEIVLNSQSAGFTIAHPLRTWDPVLAVLDPALRAARERPLPMPEGSSDRFLEPIH